MKITQPALLLSFLSLPFSNLFAQNIGINTITPITRLHVNGTAWFQGDNTPLAASAGRGIGIGYGAGSAGGYVFAFDYGTFTPKNLWLQSAGGSVQIGSTGSPLAKLDVISSSSRAIYSSTNLGEALYGFTSSGTAVSGISASGIGVRGTASVVNTAGVYGDGPFIGVEGITSGTDVNRQGVRGEINVAAGGYAGLFMNGVTWVVGTLQKSAGAFLIDHPLEPETKFLYHSFVESPDMKNIYDGVITTDASGFATVNMPAWFDSLNIDYRYQLTCMGQFAQAIVKSEISNNAFLIQTSVPNVKVSWQVTGIRNDPYARENRIPTEKLKTANEIGKYIYPKGYGKGTEALLDILKPIKVPAITQ